VKTIDLAPDLAACARRKGRQKQTSERLFLMSPSGWRQSGLAAKDGRRLPSFGHWKAEFWPQRAGRNGLARTMDEGVLLGERPQRRKQKVPVVVGLQLLSDDGCRRKEGAH